MSMTRPCDIVEQSAGRYAHLPSSKDIATATHQMGRTHTEDCHEIPDRRLSLSSSHCDRRRNLILEKIQELLQPHHQAIEENRRDDGTIHSVDHLRCTSLLGKCSQKQKRGTFHHQRGIGTRFWEDNTDLSFIIGHLCRWQGKQSNHQFPVKYKSSCRRIKRPQFRDWCYCYGVAVFSCMSVVFVFECWAKRGFSL